jgi:hypothetical protein
MYCLNLWLNAQFKQIPVYMHNHLLYALTYTRNFHVKVLISTTLTLLSDGWNEPGHIVSWRHKYLIVDDRIGDDI